MSRRVSLPGAAELFRVTSPETDAEPGSNAESLDAAAGVGPAVDEPRIGRGRAPLEAVRGDAPVDEGPSVNPSRNPTSEDSSQPGLEAEPVASVSDEDEWPSRRPVRRRRASADRRPTGRERHDEKITVYVSAEELIDLEHARLTLRGEFGLAVDRGRIVREAVAVVLADLDAKGENSIIVRRLHGR